MNSSLQGLLIALLIGLVVGVIIGYSLRQGRVSELQRGLKRNQQRTEALEREHEQRLQDTTLQLQKDYETQLAEKIERYQDHLQEKTTLLEQEYQERLAVLEQGRQPEANPLSAAEILSTAAPAAVVPDLQYVEQQVKRQYEDRLKEAARKIQQAYEQHLKQKLKESRDYLQKDYEHRLAQKIEHYETELSNRIDQLQDEYELRVQSLAPTPQPLPPSPTAVTGNWDTTMAIAPVQPPLQPPIVVPVVPAAAPEISDEKLLDLENRLRDEYDHKLAEKIERYQDTLTQRVQSLEQEYAVRLQASQPVQPPLDSADCPPSSDAGAIEETLKQEYEQKLAEKIEHYQDELTQRVDAIAQEYEARFQVVQQAQPETDFPDIEAEESVNTRFDLGDLAPPEDALGSLPLEIEEPAPLPDADPTVLNDDPFSLDELMLVAQETTADPGLDLENELGTSGFSLDELLFEQTDDQPAEDDSPGLDDLSRLS